MSERTQSKTQSETKSETTSETPDPSIFGPRNGHPGQECVYWYMFTKYHYYQYKTTAPNPEATHNSHIFLKKKHEAELGTG